MKPEPQVILTPFSKEIERGTQKSKRTTGRIARSLTVFGLGVATVAFILFLSINGASGVPPAVSALTAILVAIGLFSSTSGLFLLSIRSAYPPRARRGLALNGIGFASLFFGVILAAASSTIFGFLAGAAILAVSSAIALVGIAIFVMDISKNKHEPHSSRPTEGSLLLVGIVILFLGVAIIIASNVLTLTFYLSNLDALIYEDIGATVSAYGCVLGAHSFLRVLQYQRPL